MGFQQQEAHAVSRFLTRMTFHRAGSPGLRAIYESESLQHWLEAHVTDAQPTSLHNCTTFDRNPSGFSHLDRLARLLTLATAAKQIANPFRLLHALCGAVDRLSFLLDRAEQFRHRTMKTIIEPAANRHVGDRDSLARRDRNALRGLQIGPWLLSVPFVPMTMLVSSGARFAWRRREIQ